MKTDFTSFEVARIAQVHNERLRDWVNRGFITPSIRPAGGKGVKALFSFEDLLAVAMFKKLVEIGLPRGYAADFVQTNHQTWKAGLLPTKESLDHEKSLGPTWYLFFRRQGEIVGSAYERRGVPGLQKALEAREADAVLGINFDRILRDIYSKTEA